MKGLLRTSEQYTYDTPTQENHMTIKSGVLTIKTNIGFTYTIDYKQDTSSWAVLEQGIRFESLQEALDWIESHEKALVANHEAMYQD